MMALEIPYPLVERVDRTRRSTLFGDSPGGTKPAHSQRLSNFSELRPTAQDLGARCDVTVCAHRTHIRAVGSAMLHHSQSKSAPVDSQNTK